MKIITDYKEVEKLAEQNENEIWRFRSLLKGADINHKDLDSIVHKLYKEVVTQFDCQKCGNCCRIMRPALEKDDISKLAAYLSITPKEFEKKYIEKDERENEIVFNKIPCPFFDDNSCNCTVYPARPENCRSYPHLYKNDFVNRLIGICGNCFVCPIVYNVYELLKEEIYNRGIKTEAFLDDFDDFDDFE